eukprot:14487949-Alexandrium_andersonii.AAC.1
MAPCAWQYEKHESAWRRDCASTGTLCVHSCAGDEMSTGTFAGALHVCACARTRDHVCNDDQARAC